MTLSLITPAGINFIKDFPFQNAENCNGIDDYAGPCLTSHPLTEYTPQLRATTTNPTLGPDGFIRGFYYRIFDQIFTWGEFRFGTSGTSAGSGFWHISLPFNADSIIGSNVTPARAVIVGNGLVWDDSADSGRWPIICHLRTNDSIQFTHKMNSGKASEIVSAAGIPIPWTANDGLMWYARYKRAA